LEKADQALYRAKNHGRNRVERLDPDRQDGTNVIRVAWPLKKMPRRQAHSAMLRRPRLTVTLPTVLSPSWLRAHRSDRMRWPGSVRMPSAC